MPLITSNLHPAPSHSPEPLLAAREVHKTYRLGRIDVPVLRGASIEVHAGESIAILGASGSGKSTLLHLLGGLDRPDRTPSGSTGLNQVYFEGQALGGMSAAALDRYRNTAVGFVFQFFHLLPELSVLQNTLIPAMVRYGRFGYASRASRLRAEASELLEAFGLGHRLRHRPAELSGGERQRVAIARALINQPRVLLADEPTGNLDRTTGSGILDALAAHRAQSGRTLVVVTHDPEVAARADRVVRLVDGRVASALSPGFLHPPVSAGAS